MGVTPGLYYTTIDMSFDNGLGDVDSIKKNILLLENVSEKMTAIISPSDNSYWLVSFASNISPTVYDMFYSYKINSTGINLINQSTFTFTYPQSTINSGGQMKISPDKLSLAMIHNTLGNNGETDVAESLFTFNFDSNTGILSSLQSNFFTIDVKFNYGLEFSPDSSLLYFTNTDSFFDGSDYWKNISD